MSWEALRFSLRCFTMIRTSVRPLVALKIVPGPPTFLNRDAVFLSKCWKFLVLKLFLSASPKNAWKPHTMDGQDSNNLLCAYHTQQLEKWDLPNSKQYGAIAVPRAVGDMFVRGCLGSTKSSHKLCPNSTCLLLAKYSRAEVKGCGSGALSSMAFTAGNIYTTGAKGPEHPHSSLIAHDILPNDPPYNQIAQASTTRFTGIN